MSMDSKKFETPDEESFDENGSLRTSGSVIAKDTEQQVLLLEAVPVENDKEQDEIKPPPWWPVLSKAALRGLPGLVVEAACADSEADPAAVLMTFLAWAGAEFGRSASERLTEEVYVAHKGQCDRMLRTRWEKQGIMTGWQDLDEITSPIGWLRFVMTVLNQRQRGDQYAANAHKKCQAIMIALAQCVMRANTQEELEQFRRLRELDVVRF